MHRLSTLFFPTAVLLFSIVVVYLSVPRLIAHLKDSYPNTVYNQLVNHDDPPDEWIIKARNELEGAIDLHETSYFWLKSGNFTLNQVLSGKIEGSERENLIQKSIIANQMCLALSPVEPFVWYRLAMLYYLLDPEDVRIPEMIRLSIYTQTVEPYLLKPRVSLLLNFYKGFLDEEMNSMLNSQIRLMWKLRKKELLDLVYKNPDTGFLVSEVLANSPDDLIQYHELLRKLTQK